MKINLKIIVIIIIWQNFYSVPNINAQFYNQINEDSILKIIGIKPFNVAANAKLFYKNKIKVTKKIKDRLIYMGTSKWATEDVEKYLLSGGQYCNCNFKNYLKEDTLLVLKLKIPDSIMHFYFDSLMYISIKKATEEFKLSQMYKVNEHALRIIAFLKLKASIPFIKNDFKKNSQYYNELETNKSLAQLGDKDAINYLIKRFPYIDSLNGKNWVDNYYAIGSSLIVMNQPLLFTHLIKWLDVTKTYVPPHWKGHDGNFVLDKSIKLPQSAHLVLDDLKYMVANKSLQDILKNYNIGDDNNPTEDITNIINRVKFWLLANKNNIKLKHDIY